MLFVDKSEAKEKKEEPSSSFQRHRVDLLLGELAKKFPPKVIPPTQPEVKGKAKKKKNVCVSDCMVFKVRVGRSGFLIFF